MSIWLRLRLGICILAMFALVYAVFSVILSALGIGAPIGYALLALGVTGIQFLVAPKLVEHTLRVRYLSVQEAPELHSMLEELSAQARIPKPKLGISQINLPNAFAFGISKRNSRVCITPGLLKLLNKDELKAVLAHEISHIKHRDVMVITALSLIPMIFYLIYLNLVWGGYGYYHGDYHGERRGNPGYIVLIGIISFLCYLVAQLILMYASRIREYLADRGSALITKKPWALGSALYRLVYGNARLDRETIRDLGHCRAFFSVDPARALGDLRDLSQADLNLDGRLDEYELKLLAQRKIKLSLSERIAELFSTHPHPLHRIKRLAQL